MNQVYCYLCIEAVGVQCDEWIKRRLFYEAQEREYNDARQQFLVKQDAMSERILAAEKTIGELRLSLQKAKQKKGRK